MSVFDDENEKNLIDQKEALSSYLDSLFREMPVIEVEPPAEVESPRQSTPEVAPKSLVLPAEDIQIPVVELLEPAARLIEQSLVRKISEAEERVAVPDVASDEGETTNVYHPTAAFQVLFFSIGKLNLAVPLESLSGIFRKSDEKITAIPGSAVWHIGLMKHKGNTINMVDTAKLIVPSHRQDIVDDRRSYRYFILIDDNKWGLGCHSVAEVVTLNPNEVKWRSNRTLQPWLAGTVVEKMCALLDVEGFLKQLQQQSSV